MKNLLKVMLLASIVVCALVSSVAAAPLKAYVAPFTVTGAPNREELKGILPTLLASRLNTEAVTAVDSAAGADLTVNGSYIFFGGVFSIDVSVRRPDGSVVTRAFEQGENTNEVIPLMKKLGSALSEQIAKAYPAGSSQPDTYAVPQSVARKPSDVVRPVPSQVVQSTGDVIRPAAVERSATGGWMSQRLTGVMRSMASGRTLSSGERELFVVSVSSLYYYRQGNELKLVAQVDFSKDQEVLSVDTADLDGDGTPEIYVTIMSGEQLVSQVWAPVENRLEKVADRLPYFFRALTLADGKQKIYVQQIGTDADFYGAVQELVKSGTKYEMRNPLKLPRFGYLYNFGQLKDASGAVLTLVMSEDGYIVVYDAEGAELWRTSDKFGGTDVSFKREDLQNMQFTGSKYRWRFLDQRITVLPDGEVLVPQNSGAFVVGNQRIYKKSSVYSFVWNGSMLEEKWHLKESPSYLADYAYDGVRKEMVLLQVLKGEGLADKGASVVSLKRIE